MKKSLAVTSVLCATAILMVSTGVFADDSTPTTSSSSSASSTGTKTHKKKKASATATPQVTPQATAVPTAAPKAAVTSAPASAPKIFSDNQKLYDRVGAPGDLQKAIAAAVQSGSAARHDHSVFLWLGKVVSGSDSDRANAYIRFNLEGVAYDGPKKPSIVLTGTVYDQSGSNCKAGDSISVAVDFRDIKVDYEGTKLGEVNKGNDIADQVFDILNTHPNYQWVLMAQDWLQNAEDSMGTPTFVVKAKEGYSFLQTMDSHSNASNH